MKRIIRIIPICLLFTLSCEKTVIRTPAERAYSEKIASEKSYTEKVSKWKSYEKLVKWMEKDFSVDMERFKKFEGTLPVPRAPYETFQRKSGIYIDAAIFAEETLNRINPSYKARVVVLVTRPSGLNHYVCSFKKEGKIFIMDYGTPYKEVTGLRGPYASLEGYKKFYEENHPLKIHVEAITYLPGSSTKTE
ncbi:MAG TPA: transglutaminase-like domain-containing protein [Thermodesulfobacteriota bacterium]|nr:transglutaminase-like domain-containing protein [Thermodesulfobacteriota bacterium]